MSDHQATNNPAPQIVSDLQEDNVSLKIEKAPKPASNDPEFLDDHLGKSLADSIARLIGQAKAEPTKKQRKKKVLTPAQREQCKLNLAKGRETIRRKKEEARKVLEQASNSNPAPTSTAEAKLEVPALTAEEPAPIPATTPQPVESERLTVKMTDLLF
jgi:hypothetical protein